MTIENVLRAYTDAAITDSTLFVAAGQLINADNVEHVMSVIPSHLRDQFCEWARKVPFEKSFVFGSNLTREAAAEIQAKLDNAKLVIKEWLDHKDGLLQTEDKLTAVKK